MEQRTRFEAALDKRAALKEAEASGKVADSMAVRLALMEAVHKGTITLEAAQAELKRIQNSAATYGKVTREQAFSRG